jgi:hypothetical protein
LPVVRHKPSDLFTVLSLTVMGGLRWDRRSTVEEYLDLGRLARLSEPLELPGTNEQLLAAWVDPDVLTELDWDENLGPKPIDLRHPWRRLEAIFSGADSSRPEALATHPLWVCSARELAIQSEFEVWGEKAVGRFDELVMAREPNWKTLERVADFGLSAARDPEARYLLYTRYCAALYFSPAGLPERVHRVFKLFVRREYPTVDWDRFREAMRVVVFRGKDVAAYRNGAATTATPVPPPKEVQGVRTIDLE